MKLKFNTSDVLSILIFLATLITSLFQNEIKAEINKIGDMIMDKWQILLFVISILGILITIIRIVIRPYFKRLNYLYDIITPNIQIIEAKYGHENSKFLDVKEIVEDLIKQGKYKLTIDVHLFNCEGQQNDPAWGKRKIFRMKYLLGGEEKNISAKDDEKISLF